MKNKVVLAIAALIVAAILVSLQLSKQAQTRPQASAQPPVNESQPAATIANEDRKPATTTAMTGAPSAPPTTPADPQFQEWIAGEAKTMDHPNVDGAKKEVEIRKVIKKLTPAQSQQLLQTATNPLAPAGEKILSTYILVEGGLNTRRELKEFISAPLKEQGPHEPHSEGEIKGVREKSLRIMAIDGLFSQAKTDPKAREALAQAIDASDDPYIKAYAQEKLDQLSRQ